MGEFLFFKMKKVEKKQVAQAGRLKLYETDYILEPTIESGKSILHIEHAGLLSQGTEFISLSEASALSGLSVSRLIKLCEKGFLIAEKVSGNWMIDRRSLESGYKN
jgi:hypothetical protein